MSLATPSHPRLARIAELARREITDAERTAALELCETKRVALFIVAYNAERHLSAVVDRIPADLLERLAEVVIIDDSSSDGTWEVARTVAREHPSAPIRTFRTPFNRGYGGNQKLGYLYCLERGFDWVVLLHGDGQYAPEYLPRVLAAAAGDADAVLASRMLRPRSAISGGMPLHKWVGNRVLTGLGNRILGTDSSEFHTGYRAYRLGALARVPFQANSDDFHFDGEIIAQGVLAGWRFAEVSIPTHYGDEVCHVPGLRYSWQFLRSLLLSRLVRLGIFYKPNFDIALFGDEVYTFKRSPYSLHQWVLSNLELEGVAASLELGANRGDLSRHLAERVHHHVAVDRSPPDRAGRAESLGLDLEEPFAEALPGRPFDLCLALDVAEHITSPETFMAEVFRAMRPGGRLLVSTANVAYLPIRLSLLLGQFNYGKRGVLDMTHVRLFTVSSFVRLLRHSGFRVERVVGFPPPLTDMISPNPVLRLAERIHAGLARLWPSLFAFNFAVVATRLDDVEDILARTTGDGPGRLSAGGGPSDGGGPAPRPPG